MPRKDHEEVLLINIEIPRKKGTKKDGRGKMHIRIGKVRFPILIFLYCFSILGCIFSVIFCFHKFYHRFPVDWRVIVKIGVILGANIYAWLTFAMIAKFMVSVITKKRVSEGVYYWLLFVGFTTTIAFSFYYIYHRLSEYWKPIGKIPFLLCVNFFTWHVIYSLGQCLMRVARKEIIRPECLKALTVFLWDIGFLSSIVFSFYKFYYASTVWASIIRVVVLFIANACVWIAVFSLGDCLIRVKRKILIKNECLGNLIMSLCVLGFVATMIFSFQKFYYASFDSRTSLRVVEIILANCLAWICIGAIAGRCCFYWGHNPWTDKRIDSTISSRPSKDIYMSDKDYISEIKQKTKDIEIRRKIVEKLEKKPAEHISSEQSTSASEKKQV